MEIITKKTGSVFVVSIKGKMDAVSAPAFDGNLIEWTNAGENNFIIDLSSLEYISSAGLRSLLSAAKHIKSKGGKLMLAGLSGAVQEVFNLSGFYSIFQIFPSEAEALQAM